MRWTEKEKRITNLLTIKIKNSSKPVKPVHLTSDALRETFVNIVTNLPLR